jgi:hypothetical protein
MSGGQLGQLSQIRPPVGVAPGAQAGLGPGSMTATQGMPAAGAGMEGIGNGVPQVHWTPPYNAAPPYAGAKPTSTPFYPQLQGGFYNQMAQMLAGPSYTPNKNPYSLMAAPPQGPHGTPFGGGYGFPTAPNGGGYAGPGGR